MVWLTNDEFIETLVKNKQIKSILGSTWTSLKQYERNPKLFVKQLNKLIDDNYYSWEHTLDEMYTEYKLNTVPEWGRNMLFPDVSHEEGNLSYGEYVMDLNPEIITFSCELAIKWGIEVHNPISNDNLYKCGENFIYELVGLQGTTVNLQQIRNCVHRVDYYGEIVCLA